MCASTSTSQPSRGGGEVALAAKTHTRGPASVRHPKRTKTAMVRATPRSTSTSSLAGGAASSSASSSSSSMVKRHQCDQCASSYLRAEHLTRHKQTAHPAPGTDARRFRCSYPGCDRAYARHDLLNRHFTTHTRKQQEEQAQQAQSARRKRVKDEDSDGAASSSRSASPMPAKRRSDISAAQAGWAISSSGLELMSQPPLPDHTPPANAYFGASSFPSPNVQHAQAATPVWMGTPSSGGGGGHGGHEQAQPYATTSTHPSMTHEDLQGWLASMDAYSNSFMPTAPNDLSATDPGGLGWMFQAEELARFLPPPNPLEERMYFAVNGVAPKQPEETPQPSAYPNYSPQKMAAPTPVLPSAASPPLPPPPPPLDQLPSSDALDVASAGSSSVEPGPAWPHDYHPAAANDVHRPLDLTTIRISTAPADSAAASAIGVWPNVVIDPEGSTEAQLTVTTEVRAEMLEALRKCCALPWSQYRLGTEDEDAFMTTRELTHLLTLFMFKLHPRLPFLHAPTLKPSTSPMFMLIIMVATALMHAADIPGVNGNAARQLSLALGELARIGIVSSVENDRRGALQLANTQSWLLQTMLALSGGDRHMYQLAERNRGGIVTFARRLGLFQSRHAYTLANMVSALKDNDEALLEQTWRSWVQEEMRIRLGWSVYVYDQEYSVLLDSSPMLLPVEMALTLPCNERLWAAATAKAWLQMGRYMVAHNTPYQGTAERETLPSFLRLLFRLQYDGEEKPTNESDAALMRHVGQVTKFTAKVLACTLFRMRWDAIKLDLLLVGSDDLDAATTRGRRNYARPATSIDDGKVRSSFFAVSRAAAKTSVTRIEHHPILFDVVILQLACEQYSAAHPQLFAMLRDMAGRQGLRSAKQRHAQAWLKRVYREPALQVRLRRVTMAASQIYLFARKMLLRTERMVAAAMAGNTPRGSLSPFQTSGSTSVIAIVILFDAALALYAFARYGSMHDGGNRGETEPSSSSSSSLSVPPFLPRIMVDSVYSTREIDVHRPSSEGHSAATAAAMSIHKAWVLGAYRDEYDGVRSFPPTSTLRIADMVLRPAAVDDDEDDVAGHDHAKGALLGVADLLSRFQWGLAVLFREVLVRLVHAERV